uniref:PEAK family member 3 n=2 Tax=Gasterosteus aculeatus TaxID=69293 RepID=A0AAQ4QHG2_GASAC|nr:inactive tyrosine-protein kinase PEAK1 isoform X2 [Gasterosteus aculeatus aculeatus]
MASGPCSRAEELPPALPVKQLRRLSSARSEFDSATLSPVGLQHPNCACDDVFSDSADCHAVLCPVHQRYDPLRHQLRFFSDGTPPPVPKKRLSRTLSLPGNNVPQLSPLSPLQRRPQNFDNPAYMLAPVPDAQFHEETGDLQPVSGRPVPLLSFSQLSFDTPDEHLPCLLGRFDDRRLVSQGIQRRHLLFLRSAAQSAEAGVLLQGEAADSDLTSYQPQDFRLCEDSEPKRVGDALYYSLRCHKLPGRVLGLRVHKQTDGASSAQTERQTAHANVQSVVAHFQGTRNDSGRLEAQGPSGHSKSDDCTAAEAQSGGGEDLTSVQSLLVKGLLVSVERDLPQATLEDFVRDGSSLQRADSFEYDRRVCALLLQIIKGSQHLCNISTTVAELRPRGIFLVWPSGEREGGEASGRRRGHETCGPREETERGKTEAKGQIQMLWGTHGSPRVVLTPLPSAQFVPDGLAYIKSQIGALILYCLHSQDGPAPLDPSMPPHRRGLLQLAAGLRSESGGPRVADVAAALQALLWGPRGTVTAAVHNWLTVKRALLVMKLAERGLIQDQSAPHWEDGMCLHYLAFTDPETIRSATSLLNAEGKS